MIPRNQFEDHGSQMWIGSLDGCSLCIYIFSFNGCISSQSFYLPFLGFMFLLGRRNLTLFPSARESGGR